MKNIIFLFTAISLLTCRAQSTTVGLHMAQDYGSDGVYYKDLENDLNHFIGEWKYTEGNTSLLFKLEKKIMGHVEDSFSDYYLDALVGEYQYIENGVEKLNTLNNLLTDYEDPFEHNITGDFFTKNGDLGCSDCGLNGVKVYCVYREPNCMRPGLTSTIVFRYFIENSIEKLECKFFPEGMALKSGSNPCLGNKLPYGRYILIKQ